MVGSNSSCYATERQVQETTSPADPPHLAELQHQQWKEKVMTHEWGTAPIAIAPRGFYSLLGEKTFSWQSNPHSLGT